MGVGVGFCGARGGIVGGGGGDAGLGLRAGRGGDGLGGEE